MKNKGGREEEYPYVLIRQLGINKAVYNLGGYFSCRIIKKGLQLHFPNFMHVTFGVLFCRAN